MNIRKFKKNAKALSPVVASIILIAVTVAVSVVVAAWMGGMTIGLMGNAEQAAINNVVLTNNGSDLGGTAVCTVQNTGSATVSISSATIDGNGWVVSNAPVTITKGTSGNVTLTLATGTPFTDSAQYSIKLMTAKGNSIVYSATYSGS